ncbi:Spermidine/putrescine import ATP-binding protein PotA [Beijerinckiaceae bacterium RH AL1]|nr:Spermidine/putrescine import ATP-binding protein PotA [Beijerinckiaceae bacterium RH CH11]VVB49890.1 Spermidine/putrescine import ATP-binding protein PotA [Beijerinckiaceae bacterium RH AL8]VVC57089.1 Spermidine/putrescine import ATP-binding protein PotA [Beijerinckiaceae bacterium RH AL1]
MTPLVAVSGVTRTFPARRGATPVTALDDVTLDIPANAFVTLLGPSGCGKTTLLRMIAGFEHPDRGDIALDGRSILAEPPNRRPVNIVFQSYALFPHMSVADNVGFGLARQGRPRAVIEARVTDILALVRLEDLAARRPAELSGGQQQRVALARALAPAPRLLLLDEPLSALDLKLRRGMQVELKRLQRETGITFLLVTHDQDEALAMSDVIAAMQAGRIEQIGAPADVWGRPRSRFVADFFGANVLEGRGAGHDAAYVALRPEQVEVARPGGEGRRGRVTALSYHGTATACGVALADGLTIEALRSDLPPGLALRDEVAVRWSRDALVPLEA